VAGIATYVLAGELALGKVLAGDLPRPGFPQKLRQTAPTAWFRLAAGALHFAHVHAGRQDRVAGTNLCQAVLAAAQGRMAAASEWVLNEKRLVEQAGLRGVQDRLGQPERSLVAEAEPGPVGFVAVDMAGSVPLILVSPAYQRRGIGTTLLAAALDWLRADGATGVTAGSGGRFYIWPGVPRDLPGAVRFFTSRGWQHSHGTLDLVTDPETVPPAPRRQGGRRNRGITITEPVSGRPTDVLAFEAATFPSWTRWFTQSGPQNVLIARDDAGHIAGTLLLRGPGADTVSASILGPAAGTIGCVGVAPRRHGEGIGTALVARACEILRDAGTHNCHIGWTTRESFYRRAGYQPWLPHVRGRVFHDIAFPGTYFALAIASAALALTAH
jgi:GNAT superfamily N-acetyltransferase